LKKDNTNYLPWLDWAVANAWVEHARRMRSLFDDIFIPEIAGILDVTHLELRRLHIIASDPDSVAKFADNQQPSDDFGLLKATYTISALLRGRFHDVLGSENQRQLFVHPLRGGVYPVSNESEQITFCTTNTEEYLARFALAGAFTQKTLGGRLITWVENFDKLRMGIEGGDIDTNQMDSDVAARDKAIELVKNTNMTVQGKWVDTAIEMSLGAGSSVTS
jgi:hypothetical protein